MLPCSVLIRRGLKAVRLKPGDHLIQSVAEELLEPLTVLNEPYRRRVNCAIQADKQATVPRLSKNVIAETAKRPDFGTIVGAIDGCRHITATGSRVATCIRIGTVSRFRHGNVHRRGLCHATLRTCIHRHFALFRRAFCRYVSVFFTPFSGDKIDAFRF